MRTVRTRSGAVMPALGLGTWLMGEKPALRRQEADALRAGLDLGMTLIDTAEMYADGGSEEVVAEAMEGRREEVFLVSKVLPGNASREGTLRAAERSLKRLRTDRIDLYLLHWESSHPLEETLAAFLQLRDEGKILHFGVSNFDTGTMKSCEVLAGGSIVASNQVLYNLKRRGPERSLIPWCKERDIVIMAYSPLDQGSLNQEDLLKRVAGRLGVTPAQLAVAWTLRMEGIVSIPKASNLRHVRENAAAIDLRLTDEDLAGLDKGFPAPTREIPLETA